MAHPPPRKSKAVAAGWQTALLPASFARLTEMLAGFSVGLWLASELLW